MTPPAEREHQTLLESALVDVQSTLADLLVASDEQHAALVARDHALLERVTRQQERLSSRLAAAEIRRQEALAGMSLGSAIALLSAEQAARTRTLSDSIGIAVVELKDRQIHTSNLLSQSLEVIGQTLTFLHRLVTVQTPAYGARGVVASRQSLLVDGRA